MKKRLNAYYFKVELDGMLQKTPELYDSIIQAFSLPDNKKYGQVIQTGGNVALLGKRIRRNGIVLGTFSFIQLEDIPPKQNRITDVVNAIDLDENEGLGYYTPFLFDPSSCIIVVVSARNGVNISAIKKFIEANFNVPKFTLAPVIEPSELMEFLRTPNYKSVKFKVAKVDNTAGLVPSGGRALEEIIEVAEKYEPGTLSYDLRAGRKGHLNTTKVRQLVEALFRHKGENVKQLIVDGADDDDVRRHFDFVSDRLVDVIYTESHRNGSYVMDEVYAQLEENFFKKSQELRNLYGCK